MENGTNGHVQIGSFLDSLSDAKVRVAPSVLLLSFEKTLTLLDIELSEFWAAIREVRRGLPTFKTGQKLLKSDPTPQLMRSARKHFGNLPAPPRAFRLVDYQFKQGYSAEEPMHWLSLLEQAGFTHPAVLEYWEGKLYRVSDLSGVEMQGLPTLIEQYRAYNSSEIVTLLGCSAARQLLKTTLDDLKADEQVNSSEHLAYAMGADRCSVLLRLAAWLIAAEQVESWDWEVAQGSHNSVRAEWAIPRWCFAASSWTNPMEQALERLAKLAGWSGQKQKPVTFLGKAWAQAENTDEASKIRLLRNWIQLKKGRPSFSKLQELVRLCFDLHVKARKDLSDEVRLAYWQGACWFRFAETVAILVRDFHKQGWPDELIASMLSAYETEYRVARDLMGKPIED